MQMVGRIRRLSVKGDDPIYVNYYCIGIPAHLRYQQRRKEVFESRMLSINEHNTNFII